MSERIVIAGGVRTAYVKAGTVFKDLTAVDLGMHAVAQHAADNSPEDQDQAVGNKGQQTAHQRCPIEPKGVRP